MANKKRIALCLEYPLALRGGVSVLVESLIEGLSPRYEMVLVSPDKPAELATSAISTLISTHISWDSSHPSPKKAAMLAAKLAEAKVDLAHFHLGGNFGWGNRFPNHSPITHLRRVGIPVCSSVHLVVHLLDGYCGPQKPLWFKLALLPLAWAGKMQSLSHVRAEIAVSQHDLQKLGRWYAPQANRFDQIYHSRLREASQPGPSLAREHAILNVGHIAVRKGQVVLAEAFARIAKKFPEWKLWLAGDIVEESAAAQIKSIAAANGLENRLLLLGPRNDAYDWMSRCGIYVQPSLAEALGLALQEALFRGCPAIGTTAGGIPELIDHEKTGRLIEPNNVDQMALALEAFIQAPALREKYGRAGAASMIQKAMTFEQMIERHVKLYTGILGV